jgi:hypothetical protein
MSQEPGFAVSAGKISAIARPGPLAQFSDIQVAMLEQ